MVVIHGYRVSTWTRTVEMTCIEKGIAYDLRPIARGSAEHARLHPFQRMPVVEVDGLILFETLAITHHLDAARSGPPLQPRDLRGRRHTLTWMSVCADYLFRDVVRTLPRGREATPAERETARTALRSAERLVGSDPFLAGEALTLADLYLAPQLANCRSKVPELLDDVPGLAGWLDRMATRPSYRLTCEPGE